MADPVIIVDYDPAWPRRFEVLRERVAAALGVLAVRIEHIGSTAVPGLPAKPIIDLDVVVRPCDLAEAVDRLAAIGYARQGDLGVPGREAFDPPPGGPAHHLYLCLQGSAELRRHILFRDYVRSHPEAARDYAALKRSLAERYRDDRLAYTEGKGAFVEEILRRAAAGGGRTAARAKSSGSSWARLGGADGAGDAASGGCRPGGGLDGACSRRARPRGTEGGRTLAGEVATGWIERSRDRLIGISDRLWGWAEVGLQEYKSAGLLEDELGKAGFQVTSGVAGMPTAFTATWGSGKPVIGLLAEYDALPHLSQCASAECRPLSEGAPGHGCGHNLLGAGVLGAVLGLKEEMAHDRLPGTIVCYGCPAEETLDGKVFMARDGLFDTLDAALTWHPGDLNSLWASRSQAMNSVTFTFHGRAAHAAVNPDQGRSALDAVELMNIGSNYLREHVPEDTRIHYVITGGGGEPNVVPAEAKVWYYVRGSSRRDVDDVYARILKIAEGATLMTGTTFEVGFLSGCYDLLPNEALGNLLYECMVKLGPPAWTAEELEFARKMTASFGPGQKEAVLRAGHAPDGYLGKYLDDTICPPFARGLVLPGSSDVGDVSWITPTACSTACTMVIGTASHSWQMTATSGMSIGHKGMLLAAKSLAMAGSELFRNPAKLAEARKEFERATEGRPYRCAIPPEVKPRLDQLPSRAG